MKKNVIIPIFIPHLGCDNDCVFCNQKLITAKLNPISPKEIESHINQYLPYYKGKDFFKEIGFFGGSFTGIPYEDQIAYLQVAKKIKDNNLINEIRLSTRPDYINEKILTYLKELGVDTIELGIQSFDQEVLLASKRGHTRRDSLKACDLIKSYGFKLGIQLMIGLPEDSKEKSIISAMVATTFKPDYARIYPTLILEGTELAAQYEMGKFKPFSFDEMVATAKEMYTILENCGAYILRVGLKSTSIINTSADMAGSYHPAFRQIIEGLIAKDKISLMLDDINIRPKEELSITLKSSTKSFNSMIGHKGVNKKYFSEKYPNIIVNFAADDSIIDGNYTLEIKS